MEAEKGKVHSYFTENQPLHKEYCQELEKTPVGDGPRAVPAVRAFDPCRRYGEYEIVFLPRFGAKTWGRHGGRPLQDSLS